MRRDKDKALALRSAGKSYKEIRKELGIPLSTLSSWFANETWFQKIRTPTPVKKIEIKTLHRARVERLDLEYAKARAEAEREFRFFKNGPLFMAGVVAYWSEGDKTSRYTCKLSSADPGKIRLFLVFLTTVCGVKPQKIRAFLLLYPTLNEAQSFAHWQSKTGLKQGFFGKSLRTKLTPKRQRATYGVCTVSVSSRYLKEKMLVWVRLLGEEFPKLGSK